MYGKKKSHFENKYAGDTSSLEYLLLGMVVFVSLITWWSPKMALSNTIVHLIVTLISEDVFHLTLYLYMACFIFMSFYTLNFTIDKKLLLWFLQLDFVLFPFLSDR